MNICINTNLFPAAVFACSRILELEMSLNILARITSSVINVTLCRLHRVVVDRMF